MNRSSGTFALFFWLAFAVVLFLNLFVWLYLQEVENQFHSELKTHLLDVEHVMSRLIIEYTDDVDLGLLLPDDKSSLPFYYYQQPLEEIRLKSNLQSILLLTPLAEILVATPQTLGNQRFSSTGYTEDFQKAISGLVVVSEIKEYAGEKFMSAYAPIKNIDGFLIAVLVIEAKADFFIVLTNLKNRLLLFSFINLGLILIIALFLYRMTQRSMHYQAELKEQEHLVELGTMAASVAHELRNPLGIIEGTNDVIRKKYGLKDDEIFKYIPDEIKRLNRLIDDFLTFSRTPKLNIETLDLNILIQRIKMNISTEYEDSLMIAQIPEISFQTDAQLLEQALLNLISNALQASAPGEQVRVSISNPKKKFLQFEIMDNGPGIPQEMQDKILSPFFTTKEQGTGLGLAITNRIILHLQGNLHFTNRKEKGALFTIKIPSLKM